MKKMNTVIFGVTGSIGNSVLSIISKYEQYINIEGITCDKNVNKLIKIASKYQVNKVGFNKSKLKKYNNANFQQYEVFDDITNFHNIISNKTDIIIFAIGGLQALDLLLKIIKTGKKIGIANKECIISLGKKFNRLAKKYSTEIIPLDSEHNSIFHLLKQNFGKFKSITITATGGPFINFSQNQLKKVTVKQAIKHPVWNMGKKISIDSATMMNKSLEIIEAKFLFDLKDEQINAIIHPQAIIHALVNYGNGISTAILNKPDMQIPISSLFFNFSKPISIGNELEFEKYNKFEFIPIDEKKFPAINLGFQVMKMGGLAPHIFNYLNESLVNLFILKKIKFMDIVKLNEINLNKIFAQNSNISNPKLSDIKNINNWIDNNLYIGN